MRSVAVVTLTFDRGDGRPSGRRASRDDRRPHRAGARPSTRANAWRRTGVRRVSHATASRPTPVVATVPGAARRPRVDRAQPARPAHRHHRRESLQRSEAGAEAAIVNAGSVRIDDVLPPGPITQYDIIRVLPFGGNSAEGDVRRRAARAGARRRASRTRGTGGYLQTAGIAKTDGRWSINGKPIVPSTRYVVAIADFLLTGGEANLGFLTHEPARARRAGAARVSSVHTRANASANPELDWLRDATAAITPRIVSPMEREAIGEHSPDRGHGAFGKPFRRRNGLIFKRRARSDQIVVVHSSSKDRCSADIFVRRNCLAQEQPSLDGPFRVVSESVPSSRDSSRKNKT